MADKKTILLLGGTGAMGVYLAPLLRQQGWRVYITSRGDHVSTDPELIYLTGNAKDDDFLERTLQLGFDAIVDFMIYSTEQFRRRVQRLLEATGHYLFVSSYRVYADCGGAPITEESPRLLDVVRDSAYLKTDEYALTKARQEDILRASGHGNWTILRPAITYSKDRFQLGTMEAQDFVRRALEGKTVIFPRQMLPRQATLTWAGDVAKLICPMVGNPAAMGQAYTVSTAEHHTWGQVLQLYTRLLGMKARLVDLAVYQDIMGGPYQIRYDRMLDRVVDNSKALALAGLTQQDLTPLEEGLRRELEQFVKAPTYRRVDRRRDEKMDQAAQAAYPLNAAKRKLATALRLLKKGELLPAIRKKLQK